MEGWLKAVDAKTGEPLWKFKTASRLLRTFLLTWLGVCLLGVSKDANMAS
jgi:outer membrane protein assembly factor BamB